MLKYIIQYLSTADINKLYRIAPYVTAYDLEQSFNSIKTLNIIADIGFSIHR